MLKIAQSPRATSVALLDGYSGVAEVYLALWEAEVQGGILDTEVAGELRDKSRRACHALHQFARIFPVGQPSLWIYQGLRDWLEGKPASARIAWARCLTAAQKFAMPYEEGRAHYEIGRHATGSQRKFHLTRAAEIFEQLRAAFDLARTQRELTQ